VKAERFAIFLGKVGFQTFWMNALLFPGIEARHAALATALRKGEGDGDGA
jgi:hypothetical protein